MQWNAARRLYLRRSVDEEFNIVEDIAQVRDFIYDIQKRHLRPSNILVPPEEEGDLLVWDNWATMHTRVDYPHHYGSKTCHQCAANAAEPPTGPTERPDFSKIRAQPKVARKTISDIAWDAKPPTLVVA